MEQTQHINNETGERNIQNKILSKVPGVSPSIHAAKAPEILNAAHALKRFVRQHFPEEPLQNGDDFEFFYQTLWRPYDKSEHAARIRSTIPRDARILFTVYNYMNQQEKTKNDAKNYFNKHQDSIQQKHPELKTLDDIFKGIHNYYKIFQSDPENKKGQLDNSLHKIIRHFWTYQIKNLENNLPLFHQWFKDNQIFLQAKTTQKNNKTLA